MQIDLAGALVALKGEANPIADAAIIGLQENGGSIVADTRLVPDIALISCPLNPGTMSEYPRGIYDNARFIAESMAARQRGRIVFLISALGHMPMRRHPVFSMNSAAMFTGVRTLAMEFGPHVLVNAVGFGLIEDEVTLSGDATMLSHVPTGRAGSLAEAVTAVLFLCDPLNTYTTGQILVVDGGWSAGYGRNF